MKLTEARQLKPGDTVYRRPGKTRHYRYDRKAEALTVGEFKTNEYGRELPDGNSPVRSKTYSPGQYEIAIEATSWWSGEERKFVHAYTLNQILTKEEGEAHNLKIEEKKAADERYRAEQNAEMAKRRAEERRKADEAVDAAEAFAKLLGIDPEFVEAKGLDGSVVLTAEAVEAMKRRFQ
jgi:hypothetical protein